MKYNHITVYMTAPSQEVGQQIARALVESKLAACVNMLPGIFSVYHWQGSIQQNKEWLLIAKTKRACFDQFVSIVQQIHPYDVPEIIAMPIIAGSHKYLSWINEETI